MNKPKEATSVEDYFNQVPDNRREMLRDIRAIIFELFPGIEENMDYQLPTYIHNGQTLCALASQKNYMALYIMPYDLLEEFKDDLRAFNCAKSCIRFQELREGTLDLFRRILDYTGNYYPQSRYYGRMNAK